MADPVREALEQIVASADRELARQATPSRLTLRVIGNVARQALAASSTPARVEWRVVARGSDGSSIVVLDHDSGDVAQRHASSLRGLRNGSNYVVQRCEVGPWVDVPAEGEGERTHHVETYQPVPRAPGEHERLVRESVERASQDPASRAFRPAEGADA